MSIDRGSTAWWAILALLILLGVHFDHSARAHLKARAADLRMERELTSKEADLVRVAIVLNLRSMLHLAHGEALHHRASELTNRTELEDEAWESSEARVKLFQSLFQKASHELEKLRQREAIDEQEIQEAEDKAQGYLREISRIQGDYGIFCNQHPRIPMCDAAKRWISGWDGVDAHSAALAMNAEEEDKKALTLMDDENNAEDIEESVQKHIAQLAAKIEGAKEVEKQLHDAYQSDKVHEQELELNATAFLNLSLNEHDHAIMAEQEAVRVRTEVERYTRDSQSQIRHARLDASLGLLLSLGLITILLRSFVNLGIFGRISPPSTCPTDELGEKARLVVCTSDNSVDSGSLVDVDLQSWSSASPPSENPGACSGCEQMLVGLALVFVGFQIVFRRIPAMKQVWPHFPTWLIFVALSILAYRSAQSASQRRNQLLVTCTQTSMR